MRPQICGQVDVEEAPFFADLGAGNCTAGCPVSKGVRMQAEEGSSLCEIQRRGVRSRSHPIARNASCAILTPAEYAETSTLADVGSKIMARKILAPGTRPVLVRRRSSSG
jgi:hypothetical protein